jgi:Fibronectin type III domain
MVFSSLVSEARGDNGGGGRNMMTGRTPLVALTALTLVGGMAVASSAPAPRGPSETVRLEEASLIVEVNATDGDAGLQIFLDGDAWRRMTIEAPDGRRMLAINGRTRLRNWGLTELFSESSEPPFTEFPFRRFKRLWPEGIYRFSGTTIEGDRLKGRARLSHDIPNGPNITAPANDATVPDADLTASWTAASQPQGVNIVGYEVVVESQDPVKTFSMDVPTSVTSVTIPDEYLQPGTRYGLEVLAIEASGNQTLTAVEFRVA